MASITIYPTDNGQYQTLTGVSWDTARNPATAQGAPSTANDGLAQAIYTDDEGDQWIIKRTVITFDTSTIGIGNEVDSITLDLIGHSVATTYVAESTHVLQASPADPTAIHKDDWDAIGSVSFASIINTSLGATEENFVLNAAGIASVDVESYTNFVIMNSDDVADVSPLIEDFPSWRFFLDNQAGTVDDPRIDIEYSPAAVESTRTSRRLGFGLGLDV